MCGAAADHADHAALITKAANVSRVLLRRCYGIDVRKAIDIATAHGFDQAVAALAEQLRGKARDQEAAAVRSALTTLDVDWIGTTAEQRRALVNTAMERAGQHMALIPSEIKVRLDDAAHAVVSATRANLRRRGLVIGSTWNAVDKRIAEHLTKSTGNFVTDEYGRRRDDFRDEANAIIEAGVARGAGREEIAKQLDAAASRKFEGRSPSYWEVVAGSFVGRGRSFAQMSGYAEAGIERYQIVAVLDERTTEICRYLDGKSFAVADGLRAFEQQEQIEDPQQIKQIAPWARTRLGPDGKPVIVVNHTSGQRAVAVIERSGVGSRDDRGDFSRGRGERELNSLGLGFPPYHGLCRTTTVPE